VQVTRDGENEKENWTLLMKTESALVARRKSNRWRQRNRTELALTSASAWFCSSFCRPCQIFCASVRAGFCCRQLPKFRRTCASRSHALHSVMIRASRSRAFRCPIFHLSSHLRSWVRDSAYLSNFLGSRALDTVVSNCPTFVVRYHQFFFSFCFVVASFSSRECLIQLSSSLHIFFSLHLSIQSFI
jgi:hypothetical protein